MDAKLMLATGDVQQLKDLVNKQEQDSKMMVVVMAKQQAAAAASAGNPHPHKGNMDPRLLALASSGSSEELQTLLNGEHGQASGCSGSHGSLPIRRGSCNDTEANKSILEGEQGHSRPADGEGLRIGQLSLRRRGASPMYLAIMLKRDEIAKTRSI